MLDERYHPLAVLEGETSEPRPPLFPERVKAFELACAAHAGEWEMEMASGRSAAAMGA